MTCWADRSRARAAGLLTLAGVLFAPRAADACSPPFPSVSFASAYPADGATAVPIDTEIRITYAAYGICASASDPADDPILRLAGSSDPADAVEVTVERHAEGMRTIYVLTPTAPLATDTEYEVFGLSERAYEEATGDCSLVTQASLAHFTTGVDVDTTPPPAPGVYWFCTERIADPSYPTCESLPEYGDFTTLQIESPADELAAGLTYDVYASPDADTPLLVRVPVTLITAVQLSSADRGDFPWGTHFPNEVNLPPGPWVVVAIDGSGNRSEPVLAGEPSGPCLGDTVLGGRCTLDPGPGRPVAGSALAAALALGALVLRRRRAG